MLSEMKDVVRIKPRHFSYDLHSTIAYELNKKLANKVSALQNYVHMNMIY